MSPAAARSSSSTPLATRSSSNSTTSNPVTRLSASVTNVRPSTPSRDAFSIRHYRQSSVSSSCSFSRPVSTARATSHSGAPSAKECARNRARASSIGIPQLDHYHSRRLMYLGTMQRVVVGVERGAVERSHTIHRAGRAVDLRIREQAEHRVGRRRGQSQRPGDVVVGQHHRALPVQRQHAHVDDADPQREHERSAHAELDRTTGEHRPPSVGISTAKVACEHRQAVAVGVDARAFAEGGLLLVHAPEHRVGVVEDSAMEAAGDCRDRRAVGAGGRRCGAAENGEPAARVGVDAVHPASPPDPRESVLGQRRVRRASRKCSASRSDTQTLPGPLRGRRGNGRVWACEPSSTRPPVIPMS